MDFKEYSKEIAAGNQEAFLSFCRQYKDVVYQNALSRLNDEETARQASRSVFFKVYQQLRHSSQPSGSFYTWLDALVAQECEKYAPPSLEKTTFPPSRRKISEKISTEDVFEEAAPSPVFSVGKLPPEADFGVDYPLAEENPSISPSESESRIEEPSLFLESVYSHPSSQMRGQALNPSRPTREDPDRDVFDDVFPDKKQKKKRRRKKKKGHPFLSALGTFILLCIALALLWALVGILMQLHIFPIYDLGYSWFNAHIYPLF